MHRLPTQRAVTRFKIAAWLFAFLWIQILLTSGILIHSLVVADTDLTYVALGLIAGCVLVAVIQWAVASRARCPLCHAHSVARNGCSKHRTAKRLCGSYRLRVAVSVIFKKSFRCPYCGESTAVRPRLTHLPRRKFS